MENKEQKEAQLELKNRFKTVIVTRPSVGQSIPSKEKGAPQTVLCKQVRFGNTRA